MYQWVDDQRLNVIHRRQPLKSLEVLIPKRTKGGWVALPIQDPPPKATVGWGNKPGSLFGEQQWKRWLPAPRPEPRPNPHAPAESHLLLRRSWSVRNYRGSWVRQGQAEAGEFAGPASVLVRGAGLRRLNAMPGRGR